MDEDAYRALVSFIRDESQFEHLRSVLSGEVTLRYASGLVVKAFQEQRVSTKYLCRVCDCIIQSSGSSWASRKSLIDAVVESKDALNHLQASAESSWAFSLLVLLRMVERGWPGLESYALHVQVKVSKQERDLGNHDVDVVMSILDEVAVSARSAYPIVTQVVNAIKNGPWSRSNPERFRLLESAEELHGIHESVLSSGRVFKSLSTYFGVAIDGRSEPPTPERIGKNPVIYPVSTQESPRRCGCFALVQRFVEAIRHIGESVPWNAMVIVDCVPRLPSGFVESLRLGLETLVRANEEGQCSTRCCMWDLLHGLFVSRVAEQNAVSLPEYSSICALIIGVFGGTDHPSRCVSEFLGLWLRLVWASATDTGIVLAGTSKFAREQKGNASIVKGFVKECVIHTIRAVGSGRTDCSGLREPFREIYSKHLSPQEFKTICLEEISSILNSKAENAPSIQQRWVRVGYVFDMIGSVEVENLALELVHQKGGFVRIAVHALVFAAYSVDPRNDLSAWIDILVDNGRRDIIGGLRAASYSDLSFIRARLYDLVAEKRERRGLSHEKKLLLEEFGTRKPAASTEIKPIDISQLPGFESILLLLHEVDGPSSHFRRLLNDVSSEASTWNNVLRLLLNPEITPAQLAESYSIGPAAMRKKAKLKLVRQCSSQERDDIVVPSLPSKVAKNNRSLALCLAIHWELPAAREAICPLLERVPSDVCLQLESFRDVTRRVSTMRVQTVIERFLAQSAVPNLCELTHCIVDAMLMCRPSFVSSAASILSAVAKSLVLPIVEDRLRSVFCAGDVMKCQNGLKILASSLKLDWDSICNDDFVADIFPDEGPFAADRVSKWQIVQYLIFHMDDVHLHANVSRWLRLRIAWLGNGDRFASHKKLLDAWRTECICCESPQSWYVGACIFEDYDGMTGSSGIINDGERAYPPFRVWVLWENMRQRGFEENFVYYWSACMMVYMPFEFSGNLGAMVKAFWACLLNIAEPVEGQLALLFQKLCEQAVGGGFLQSGWPITSILSSGSLVPCSTMGRRVGLIPAPHLLGEDISLDKFEEYLNSEPPCPVLLHHIFESILHSVLNNQFLPTVQSICKIAVVAQYIVYSPAISRITSADGTFSNATGTILDMCIWVRHAAHNQEHEDRPHENTALLEVCVLGENPLFADERRKEPHGMNGFEVSEALKPASKTNESEHLEISNGKQGRARPDDHDDEWNASAVAKRHQRMPPDNLESSGLCNYCKGTGEDPKGKMRRGSKAKRKKCPLCGGSGRSLADSAKSLSAQPFEQEMDVVSGGSEDNS